MSVMLNLCCICGLGGQSGEFIDTVKSLSSPRAIGKLENSPEILWQEQFIVEFESQEVKDLFALMCCVIWCARITAHLRYSCTR